MEKAPEKPQTSSHSSSRRTSNTIAGEPLPTPPPDPRANTYENIFKYPPATKNLLDYAVRQEEFYKSLNKTIEQDCKLLRAEAGLPASKTPTSDSGEVVHKCEHCQKLREECEHFIDPLQTRLDSSITASLAAYGAVEQLNRLYSMWDKFCTIENELRQRKECLRYVNLLNEKVTKIQASKETPVSTSKPYVSDTEVELEQSIELLDSILATPGTSSTTKRNPLKQQRERSKSVVVDDFATLNREREGKNFSGGPHLLRRQSTYSEGKSKVSKWTKVKAAFKWERANVPALSDTSKEGSNGIGLIPVNHEVARYLRVPSIPCGGGGSSADSILSSSSGGHLLSEVGTPGTISSASSMDDIDSNCRNAMRRDSSKSDTRCDSRITDDGDLTTTDSVKPERCADVDQTHQRHLARNDSSKSTIPSKSSSNKSLRKCKVVSDFEVLPEDVIVDIKSTPIRKPKPPPSPLNLNLRQDLNDLDYFYSPHLLKSPKDGTQSLNRSRKIASPGNSSVPSSPSRHSDFFAEFESEDLSSGDFSEPTTPNHLSTRKTFQQKQDEINQRYQMLRAKLDMEFEAKRREWEKMKSHPNTCRAISLISPPKREERSPNQVFNSNLSAKLLEENLTPDFKKKLRKWRVKKQFSVSGSQSQQIPTPASPNKDVSMEHKAKIDWNLWKTGQLKLEGQGLSPLPEQKDLPEEFQKKLEQWNKIKRGGSLAGGNDSLKRSSKNADGGRKGSDDDRGGLEKEKRAEKHKPHERGEKLAKLKAIVADHPVKKIEVKTSAGVMKFEGISRKFTRKLYEWEKARGIGPESSTFALLHPGYCPIDVGRISKDIHNNENSPTLSRSLSLDSISPNIALPAISHQASSLSLNDVNELKEMDGTNSSDPLVDAEFKKYEEPEAVMVEVEDDIVETATPLITPPTLVQQQTPIYKYEELACNDYCNSRRIQSYESHTNLAPLLSALKHTDELFAQLKMASPDITDNEEIRHCETALSFIRNIYPYYTENLMKTNVLNAILDVQSELSRISDLNQKSPLDEACCQEMMEERIYEYNEEFKGLRESLELLRQNIHGGINRYPKDIVPDINITSEDGHDSSMYATCDTTSKDQLSTTLEVTDEPISSHLENDTETPTSTVQRTFSNGNSVSTAAPGACKKKLRLRKMGSRQNSKTESDSSDNDTQSVLETPRRLKRKNFRLKQRSFDDDYRKNEEFNADQIGEDVVYVLKVKPGHPIEQCENIRGVQKSSSNACLMSTEASVPEEPTVSSIDLLANQNIFVKTKRKVFTTVEEPSAIDGIAVIERDADNLQQSSSGVFVIVPCKQTERTDEKSDQEEVMKIEQRKLRPSLTSELELLHNPKTGNLHKSLSLDDVRHKYDYEDETKCHSVESIKPSTKQVKGVRPPLASDSFRVINKSCSLQNAQKTPTPTEELSGTQKRMQHRFKKNPDKSHIPHTKCNGAILIKKIAKTNSGSSVDQANLLAPDQTDNTRPKICRKLERKSLTPTTQHIKFEFPTPTNSEPTTPLFAQSSNSISSKPHTPLTERAQRLQKAKEEFLQGTLPRPKPSFKRRDEIVRNETWEQYRRSDTSLSSAATGEDGNLLKSLSVDTIMAGTPTQSEAGTDVEVGLYDSLPRAVSRSGKISSKLGFATLASKFRRVKGKKGKESGPGNSALSALCRQSLLADVIAVPQIMGSDAERPTETVMKSQSSPHALIGGEGGVGASAVSHVRREHERLNKSQSEQYVKESYV